MQKKLYTKSLFLSQLNNKDFFSFSVHFITIFLAARSSKMVFKLMGFKVVVRNIIVKVSVQSMSVKRELNYLHLISDNEQNKKKNLQMD